jgi:hypothetical protein
MKKCFKCGIKKELSLFYKHKQMKDGRLNKCISCAKRDVNERYVRCFEQIRDYEKKRFKTEHRKLKLIDYQKKRRSKFPGKYKCRSAVQRALKTGEIIRAPCIHCGNEKTEAHHRDYRKPLDIVWVCFTCHRTIEHGINMRTIK